MRVTDGGIHGTVPGRAGGRVTNWSASRIEQPHTDLGPPTGSLDHAQRIGNRCGGVMTGNGG